MNRITRVQIPKTNLGFSICRHFQTQSSLAAQYHFDTRKFAYQLEREGFSGKQSSAVLKALSNVIEESIKNVETSLVTKEALSRQSYQQKVDFVKLKGELQTLDKTEFLEITREYERIKTDIEKLRQKLKEGINKTQAGVRLDLNLEKGRIREEMGLHDIKIAETDARIDQELSNMKTQIESVKTQAVQWLIGVCTGTFAVVLAYIRLLT
ncbi:DUF1640-domain-containing protein [Nadsonia fulvescens var. elongata DSM 6958]|uniref:DUF1640-domain-containing protein n=1 Tax=Nadsonia fulvescens var. elongata DSM 6958 TaxID=857566 RepID=A0A1E3PMY8_9ASCO|nr:DUF1640-domain-containing protein [Nadsonia fulvescens var. elongata DSM 6958]